MEYIIPIVVIEAYGDYMLANYALKGGVHNFAVGSVSYFVLLILFVKAIKDKGLAWSNTAWDGWSTLATSSVAIFSLGERPSFVQMAGIGFTCLGLILLGFDGTRAKK
jgi:multidrug transporter EmrE-like cation transporter